MAKLYLKFEQAVLKEFALSQGVVTIGRLPDNLIQVDNLAVSGHHAKIYWEVDHYVLEDNNSLNGTFVNNRKVSKVVLKDGDDVLIGKHTLAFKDEWHEDAPGEATQKVEKIMPMVPTLDSTVVLDTKKAREMLARQAPTPAPSAAPMPPPPPRPAAAGAPAASSAAASAPAPAPVAAPAPPPPAPARDRTGQVTIMSGKTEHSQYTLSGKLSVIGKSDMASIKLKGWFAPKVAAVINKRDAKYFIAASERNITVKVNEEPISGQHELKEGDMVEVAGIRMAFGYTD